MAASKFLLCLVALVTIMLSMDRKYAQAALPESSREIEGTRQNLESVDRATKLEQADENVSVKSAGPGPSKPQNSVKITPQNRDKSATFKSSELPKVTTQTNKVEQPNLMLTQPIETTNTASKTKLDLQNNRPENMKPATTKCVTRQQSLNSEREEPSAQRKTVNATRNAVKDLNEARIATSEIQSPSEKITKKVGSHASSGESPFLLTERPAARILALVPYNGRSHFIMFGKLFKALAQRGHQVDVVSHFPLDDPPANYHDLGLNGTYETWEDNLDMDLVNSINQLTDAIVMWQETLDVCSKVVEHPTVRELAESSQSYDVVLSEVFGAECLTGFAHKFRAPLVGLISSVAPPASLDRLGNPDHPAYTANYFLPYSEHMTFSQRLVNTLYGWAVRRLKYLLCDRSTDSLARRLFGPDLPPVSDLVRNTSLILVNSHFSANQARPMMPGVVEVGGLHIGQPSPLPEELERFVSEAPAGVVMFSLGTMVRVATWSEERLRALWAAMGALPQRVLIKSRDPLPGAPANVRVQRWMPQFDLLCHPKVMAFVTHGGLMGTQEAVWAGVPMLGIPMFADQRMNLATYVSKGVAIVLEYEELTHERLSDAFRQLLEDRGYRDRAAALSRQFRDRPQAPLETAVWWVEYVVAHGGAPHLRSSAADLPLHQYLLLDVLGALLLAAAIAVSVVWFTLATVYRFIGFGSKGYPSKVRLPSVTSTGQRKRYTKTTKQH